MDLVNTRISLIAVSEAASVCPGHCCEIQDLQISLLHVLKIFLTICTVQDTILRFSVVC